MVLYKPLIITYLKEIFMSKKSYEDFANAFYQLKKDHGDISYGKISISTGIVESSINALANRRRSNPPSEIILKKIANFFEIKPEYFYEYRLKQLLEYIDSNREFLDDCLKQTRKYKK